MPFHVYYCLSLGEWRIRRSKSAPEPTFTTDWSLSAAISCRDLLNTDAVRSVAALRIARFGHRTVQPQPQTPPR